MNELSQQTRNVVSKHLNAFVLDLGIEAIVSDYDDDAVFIAPDATYRGKNEIRSFFERFVSQLPEGARKHFKLHAKETSDELAFITWSVGELVPLGTDTFVVRNEKIIQQTFAMYQAPKA